MKIIFKPASAAAAAAKPDAIKLANSLSDGKGVANRVMSGFLLRATGNGKRVIVYAIEPGGFIGGMVGNLHRYNYDQYPQIHMVVSFTRMPIGAISGTIGATAPLVDVDTPAILFKAGGVHAGGELTWDSTHNTLPGASIRACPVPSAILYPAVAGGGGVEANKSVLIQRLNARASQWDGVGGSFASPYAILLNQALHDGGIEQISHVELAASVLPTGDYSLAAGLCSCIEWGAPSGVVAYSAGIPEVPGALEATYQYSVQPLGGIPATSTEMVVPEGTVISLSSYSVYAYAGTASVSSYKGVFLSRYDIASADLPPDVDGNVKQEHTPSVMWTTALDGSSATGELAWMTYPATITPPSSITPLTVTWTDLWRWEDLLLWSSRAGFAGGQAEAGEQIIAVGTVRVRRYREIPVVRQIYPPAVASVPPPDPVYTEEVTTAHYHYHDRHLVRATIDPATGGVSYESLYQFVNCDTVPLGFESNWVTGNDDDGDVVSVAPWGYQPTAGQDLDVLSEYRHTPLCGFTWVKPAVGVTPEVRAPYVACQRITYDYDLLPAGYFSPQSQGCPGTGGTSNPGPTWNDGGMLVVEEGEVYYSQGFRPYAGARLSLPRRQLQRNAVKADLANGRKIVLVGASGGEVVMDTGDYYPAVLPTPAPVRRSVAIIATLDYYPDRVDLGSPVCQYAPGVVAIAVIPKAQYPEPRPFLPHPPAYNEIRPESENPDFPGFSGIGGDNAALADYQARWAALRALPAAEPIPAPLPQNYYIALCDITTGALLAVSPPFHTSTATADTVGGEHRRATVALSCIELGETDPDTGVLTKHGGLIISVREPVRKTLGATLPGRKVYITWDLCATIKPYTGNPYAAPLHYLGSPLVPAQIGVTTGSPGIKGLRVSVAPP